MEPGDQKPQIARFVALIKDGTFVRPDRHPRARPGRPVRGFLALMAESVIAVAALGLAVVAFSPRGTKAEVATPATTTVATPATTTVATAPATTTVATPATTTTATGPMIIGTPYYSGPGKFGPEGPGQYGGLPDLPRSFARSVDASSPDRARRRTRGMAEGLHRKGGQSLIQLRPLR